MADYGCFPLWEKDPDTIGDIDPTTLPLRQKTIERLGKWADAYDATLNIDDPASSGFSSLEAQEAFEQEGISLWHQLHKELTPKYAVFYFSERLGKHLTNPNQLKSNEKKAKTY